MSGGFGHDGGREELRARFEELDQTLRSGLDRLRAVIYQNKKSLEAPIFQNRQRLDALKKRSGWSIAIIIIQLMALTWLGTQYFQLRGQVDTLTAEAKQSESERVKSIESVESDLFHLQKEVDKNTKRTIGPAGSP